MFARGTDDALWHIWQTGPHARPWSGLDLAGRRHHQRLRRSQLNTDGRLEVFARGTRLTPSGTSGKPRPTPAPWSAWSSLGRAHHQRPGGRVNPMDGLKCLPAARTTPCGISGKPPPRRAMVGLGFARRRHHQRCSAVVNSDGRIEALVEVLTMRCGTSGRQSRTADHGPVGVRSEGF